jgi:hypothetical protein
MSIRIKRGSGLNLDDSETYVTLSAWVVFEGIGVVRTDRGRCW